MSNLFIFFIGQLFSGFAFELFHSATAFYILTSTGSPLKFSLAYALDNLPKMLFLQIAGYVTDKFDRKKLFVLIDLFQASFLFFVFYILSFHEVSVNTLLLLTFVAGSFKAFTYPATKAIVPMLAKDKKRMKASSFEISNDKIARTLAPSVAILVFAKFGLKASVLTTAVIYVVASVVKMFLVVDYIEVKKESLKETVANGFKSLFKNKLIVFAWINSVVSQFIFHPFLTQVIPNVLKEFSKGVELNSFLKFIVKSLGGNFEDVYLSLSALISLASTAGVIASLLYLQNNKRNVDWKRGMKISTMLLMPSSLAISLSIIYLTSIGSGSAASLALILFPINAIFYFMLNTYTVFFTFFYQEEVPKQNMGRFVANLMTIFMFVKMLGHLFYGWMLSRGFALPVIVLISASLIKWIIFRMFERELNTQ
ncbi:MAG TPA: hypothetical protein DEP20_01610 [Fusobacteria bacterium]|nr:hypothetical protein [Fusobacteriota bacterium]|tara:strand:- start:204 stop:1478 length:1275 start_codon:yes stop_codon:yes gene_type:complete